MNQPDVTLELSLLGGPLHRLGCRLGLVRGGTNTIPLGLALAAMTWGGLIILTLVEGLSERVFSISVIGGHVRLLVAIPLLFLCEAWITPRMAAFVQLLVNSEIVPRAALPTLEREIARISRWRDAWLPEGICLLAVVFLSVSGTSLGLTGISAGINSGQVAGDMPLTAQWYLFVCLPLFRFLLLRWLLRLLLWSYFLWRLSRISLHLVPTHPDGVAGMGFLEVVHAEFTPLIMAFSAFVAATFAEELSRGATPFEAIYPTLSLLVALDAVLFLGPLCIFGPMLWVCKVRGWADYMRLGSSYVGDFEKKWLAKGAAPDELLLGTADIQSLADLNNGISVVRGMRLVPISMRLMLTLGGAALLPMLPLLLIVYPVDDLVRELLKKIVGI